MPWEDMGDHLTQTKGSRKTENRPGFPAGRGDGERLMQREATNTRPIFQCVKRKQEKDECGKFVISMARICENSHPVVSVFFVKQEIGAQSHPKSEKEESRWGNTGRESCVREIHRLRKVKEV